MLQPHFEVGADRPGRHPCKPEGDRPIELTVVRHGEVEPFTYPCTCDFPSASVVNAP